MPLNSSRISDTNDIPLLAIAIKKVNNSFNHVGIVYRPEEEQTTLLVHLAGHHRLKNDGFNEDTEYLWGLSDLHISLQIIVVGQILNILKHQKISPIPYSFIKCGVPSFNSEGAYINHNMGEGLTCATFVLDVFSSLGIDILDQNDWPYRTEDQEWKKLILQLMQQDEAIEEEHIIAMQNANNIIRFRPEEVVTGFVKPSNTWPVGYEAIACSVDEVLNVL